MSKTTKRRRPTPGPKYGFTLPFLGVLDCRTADQRAADERAGRTFDQVAAERVAEMEADGLIVPAAKSDKRPS